MHKQGDTLLLIGLAMLAIGCGLLFGPIPDEPLWAQWLVGPTFFYLGFPLAIVGVAIRIFGRPSNAGEAPLEPKPHR